MGLLVLLAEKTERSKPCHSSYESIRGKDFDTSTNYVRFSKHLKRKMARGFLTGGEPFVTDFCSSVFTGKI